MHSGNNGDLTKGQAVTIAGVVGGFLIVLCGYLFCWVTVPPGHVGVMSWFGEVTDATLSPGPHVVSPLKKVTRVNCQTIKNEEPAVVPTKTGLMVEIKATMQYKIDPVYAPKLLREVGDPAQYEAKIVDPIFRQAVRDACGEFGPEALYTVERAQVDAKVTGFVTKELTARGFIVEGIQLLDPKLPETLKQRIEAKAGAEQDAERMQFVLKTKKLEADGRVIEARGIAESQEIIQQKLTHNYLIYYWINALKEHPGATIYIPTGSDGMPMFREVSAALKK